MTRETRPVSWIKAALKEFETFPMIVSLLPKEILGREHLHMLNQTQIEQIFLEKRANRPVGILKGRPNRVERKRATARIE